ncbi:MAG: T9SS C-terminal target domain-containing protein [Opitutaceae bacterium]
MYRKTLLFSLLSTTMVGILQSSGSPETVEVTFDLSAHRWLGDVAELERNKYFNIHTNPAYAVLTVEDHEAMRDDFQLGFGRGFNGPFWYYEGKDSLENPFPSEAQAKSLSRAVNDLYETAPTYGFKDRRTVVTDHPYMTFDMGLDLEATADWTVSFFKHFYNDDTRPIFYEPMNEPFVHAGDFGKDRNAVKKRMSELYREIGKAFDESGLDVKVLGYASAWPSMELNDFSHWETNMKTFMDIAGEHMDGISVHLYDGTNVTGQDNRRSGANAEAILDLIETYSYIKWGMVKPHAITEYGDIPKGYPDHYTEEKSSQEHRAYNHIIFSLFERENRLLTSVPFITSKSPWFYEESGTLEPYLADMWRPDPDKLKDGQVNGYLFTKKIYFYQLWKDVQGARTVAFTDNPDVQVRTFVDGTSVFICLNNYDDHTQALSLKSLQSVGGFKSGSIRRLDVPMGQIANYSDEAISAPVDRLKIQPYETIVLQYNYKQPVTFSQTVKSETHYSKSYLQPIKSGEAINFEFAGIPKNAERASLRMSIGRKPNRSKLPKVLVNGTPVEVPTNWVGYDQSNRSDFFGAITIPLDPAALKDHTKVELKFPDDGGHVSSLILVTETAQ